MRSGPSYMPPVSDGSGRDRASLQRASKLLDEAGWRIKNEKRVNDKGEPLNARVPDLRSYLRAHRRALCEEPRTARHRCPYPPRRPRPISAAPEGFRFRHHHPALCHAQYAGRRAAQLFRLRTPRTLGGSLNLAGIKDPAVDALIEKIIGAEDPRGDEHRGAGARPGAYGPAITGCRTGTRRPIRLPIGTSSAGRRPNRNSIAEFSIRGGSRTRRTSGPKPAVLSARSC